MHWSCCSTHPSWVLGACDPLDRPQIRTASDICWWYYLVPQRSDLSFCLWTRAHLHLVPAVSRPEGNYPSWLTTLWGKTQKDSRQQASILIVCFQICSTAACCRLLLFERRLQDVGMEGINATWGLSMQTTRINAALPDTVFAQFWFPSLGAPSGRRPSHTWPEVKICCFLILNGLKKHTGVDSDVILQSVRWVSVQILLISPVVPEGVGPSCSSVSRAEFLM